MRFISKTNVHPRVHRNDDVTKIYMDGDTLSGVTKGHTFQFSVKETEQIAQIIFDNFKEITVTQVVPK